MGTKKNFFPKAGATTTGRKIMPFPWSLQAGCALALEQEEEGKKYTHSVLVPLGRGAEVSHAIQLHRSPPLPHHHRDVEQRLGCCHETKTCLPDSNLTSNHLQWALPLLLFVLHFRATTCTCSELGRDAALHLPGVVVIEVIPYLLYWFQISCIWQTFFLPWRNNHRIIECEGVGRELKDHLVPASSAIGRGTSR